jgi:hypothetical protein
MKSIKRYAPVWILICLLTSGLASCGDDDDFEWSKDYDIEWPVSTITNVQPLNAAPGSTITITGTNLQHAYIVYIGSFASDILTKSDTQLTVKVPAAFSEPSTVAVYNIYRRTFPFTGGELIPIEP